MKNLTLVVVGLIAYVSTLSFLACNSGIREEHVNTSIEDYYKGKVHYLIFQSNRAEAGGLHVVNYTQDSADAEMSEKYYTPNK